MQQENNQMSRFTCTSGNKVWSFDATQNHRAERVDLGRLNQVVDLHRPVLGAAQALSLPGRPIANGRNADFVENVQVAPHAGFRRWRLRRLSTEEIAVCRSNGVDQRLGILGDVAARILEQGNITI